MTQADTDPPSRMDLSRLELPAMRQQIQDHLEMENQVRQAQQDAELAQSMALQFERELDEERKRVARDVGEGLAEQVATIKSLAQTLQKRLATSEPSLSQLATMIDSNADGILAHIRHIVRSMRHETLVSGGMIQALRALVEDWRLRRPNQRFELLTEPADEAAFGLGEPDVEAVAFRVVELALQDAAQAELWITETKLVVVSARSEDGQMTLQVSHSGRSRRREAELIAGPAWVALSERLKPLAGHISAGPGDGGGFELIAVLPWPVDL